MFTTTMAVKATARSVRYDASNGFLTHAALLRRLRWMPLSMGWYDTNRRGNFKAEKAEKEMTND
jgi:hypothetical protein